MRLLLILVLTSIVSSSLFAQAGVPRKMVDNIPYFHEKADDSLLAERMRTHHVKRVTITGFASSNDSDDSAHVIPDTAMRAVSNEMYRFLRNGDKLEHVFNHIDGTQEVERWTLVTNGTVRTSAYQSYVGGEFDDSSRTVWTYDANGRLIHSEIVYGADTNHLFPNVKEYSYDAAGRLTQFRYTSRRKLEPLKKNNFQDNSSQTGAYNFTSLDFTYDKFGRLLQRRTTIGDDVAMNIVTYTYDERGRPLVDSLIDSGGGMTILRRSYDAAGGWTATTSLTPQNYLGGETRAYDKDGRLLHEQNDNMLSSTIDHREFRYDDAGRLILEVNVDDSIYFTYTPNGTLAQEDTRSHNRLERRILFNERGLPLRDTDYPELIFTHKNNTQRLPAEYRYTYEYF